MAMFSIGEFSRLAHVPIKTLRYYDEIGLFTPAEVDPITGYRRYTASQLSELNRVLALRNLGFGLDQIRHLVGISLSAAELRGMLLLRRSQVERDLAEANDRMADIEIRLHQIEEESTMTDVGIVTKVVPAVTFAGAREVVHEQERMRERCIALNDEACRLISRLGLRVNGPSCALYYPREDAIDVEMGYPVRPVDPAVTTDHGVHVLPETEVAYAVYTGSYDDFGAVGRLHVALRTWVSARGTTSAAPVRELYLQPPTDGPLGVMELQYPLR